MTSRPSRTQRSDSATYRVPFWDAVTQLEQAEALEGGAAAERLLAEARDVFERLSAAPWLERAGGTATAVEVRA